MCAACEVRSEAECDRLSDTVIGLCLAPASPFLVSNLRAKNISDSALMFDAEYLWDLGAVTATHDHPNSDRLQHSVAKRENIIWRHFRHFKKSSGDTFSAMF